MTQSVFESKYGRLAMPCPFGDNDSANISPILSAPAQGDFNFETGFNTPYSAPKSNGGKFVTRMEMNAIGNLASRNDFYGMCGGLNTFSAKLASAIGGYPKGAVLDYLQDYKLYKVISLVDGNMVNFTTDGIDGINWMYLNQDNADPERPIAFSFDIDTAGQTTIGVFKSLKSTSEFLVKNEVTKTSMSASDIKYLMSGSDVVHVESGAAILMYDLGTDPTTIPIPYIGWTTLYGGCYNIGLSTQTGIQRVDVNIARMDEGTLMVGLVEGHYYAVVAYGPFADRAYINQEGTVTEGTTVTVSSSTFSLSGKYTIYY